MYKKEFNLFNIDEAKKIYNFLYIISIRIKNKQ